MWQTLITRNLKITRRYKAPAKHGSGLPAYWPRSINPSLDSLSVLLWIFFIITVTFGNAHADDVDSTSLNWAYQSGLQDGFFIGTQENAHIYKLPISYTLRDFNDHKWALKLKLPLTVGIYDIEAGNRNIDLNVMSVVPGIELQMPVNDNWILMPSVNFGFGKDTSSGGFRYLYSLGIKHHVFFRWKQFDFTFGNRFRYDGYSAEGNGRSGHIPTFDTGLDMRFPLGFNLFKKPSYLSFYGVYHHYFDGVTVIYAIEKSFEVDNQQELGLTLSTIPSWKIWALPIDRVGIGYRFGDRFSSVRLVFGMPF